MKWIFVGLGNPGGEYVNTRHNTGRIVLEAFRKHHDLPEWEMKKPYEALVSTGDDTMLIEPETFMNKSGKSLISLVKSKKQAEQLVVIYDDLDLPLGSWKFAFDRGSGGHKGLESIMRAIKTKAFVRVRVGVSSGVPGKVKKPKGEEAVVKFILGKFKDSELAELKKVSKQIVEGLDLLVEEGREHAMNEWNKK